MLILSSISDCKLESAEGFKLGFIVPFAKSNRFVYRQRRSFMLMQVFVLLVLTSGVLCAQEYNFRNFGVTEGLNNLAVRQIYQDRAIVELMREEVFRGKNARNPEGSVAP
jgi:hypothetical protein